MLANLFFDLFSFILLGSAVMVVSSRNPVHSVLFLILAFINAAILFLMSGAEFLAMVLVIVYVGAVAVLFMFVVMMLDVNFTELREGFQRYAKVGLPVAVILFAEIALVLGSFVAAPGAAGARLFPTPAGMDNTQALGSLLYTNYLVLFQLAGVILLTAMIGAIVLTHRDRKRGKTQDIDTQHLRMPANTLTMVKAKLGQGAAMPEHAPEMVDK